AAQAQQVQTARSHTDLRASVNHGRPPVAATPRPTAFQAAVPARQAGAPYNPPPNRGAARANPNAPGTRPGNPPLVNPNAAGTRPETAPRPNPPATRPENTPPRRENNPPRRENNVPRPPTAVHPNDLPPHPRPTPPNTGNPQQDQRQQQQQEKIYNQ